MYIINTIPHVKCNVRYLRTRCFCIRNLTRSLRSLVRFLIQKQLVCKYRTPALSMKYSLYLQTVRQNWGIVRRIVHSKLKLFHFQIKAYYLSDANHQTDNPSHTNNPSLVWKRTFLSWWMSRPGLELGVCVSAFAFSQRLFLNWLLTFLCVK